MPCKRTKPSHAPIMPNRHHIAGQRRQGAQIDAGFARRMKIGTARSEKAVTRGQPGEFIVLLDRMAAGDDLDPGAAEPSKFIEQGGTRQRIELVAPGMSIVGNAAGAAYPSDRLFETGPAMRHVAGLALNQVIGKHFMHIGADAALDQEAGEMRARDMAAQLDAIGISGAYEGALQFVANPNLISRTHFARFLIERGVCADVHEVFANYLIQGKPGYVPHRWAGLEEAVGWIRGAGGVPVIAHPGRYKFDALAFSTLFDEFRRLGGAGIEVVTGSHTVEQYDEFARLAARYGFLASRGSDFHAPV